jgi:hypothetical protein
MAIGWRSLLVVHLCDPMCYCPKSGNHYNRQIPIRTFRICPIRHRRGVLPRFPRSDTRSRRNCFLCDGYSWRPCSRTDSRCRTSHYELDLRLAMVRMVLDGIWCNDHNPVGCLYGRVVFSSCFVKHREREEKDDRRGRVVERTGFSEGDT